MFCKNCGNELSDRAVACPKCGEPTTEKKVINPYAPQQKDTTIAWLLWFFLAGFGAHRFYFGHTGMGILYIVLTLTSFLVIPAIVLLILWIIDATKINTWVMESYPKN